MTLTPSTAALLRTLTDRHAEDVARRIADARADAERARSLGDEETAQWAERRAARLREEYDRANAAAQELDAHR